MYLPSLFSYDTYFSLDDRSASLGYDVLRRYRSFPLSSVLAVGVLLIGSTGRALSFSRIVEGQFPSISQDFQEFREIGLNLSFKETRYQSLVVYPTCSYV